MTSNSQSGSVGSYFNNDINIDILWHNSASGGNTAWLMNGTSRASSSSLPSLAGWDLEGINDFSGDGEADIIWRNYATGENRVWLMNDTSVSTSINLVSLNDPSWRIEGTGDFNADGKTDILWRNYKTGANTVWLMNGTSRMSGSSLQALSDVNWQIEGTGDFNADGNADIVWRNCKTGANTVWFMNGTSRIGSSPLQALSDVNWQIEGTGDFNTDGRTDILWRNYSTGANTVWFMNGTSRTSEVALATVKDTSWKPLVQSSVIPHQPDLIVQSQHAPSSANVGDTITIGSYTRNLGKASASSSYIRYWLSDDATLNTSTDRYLGDNYVASLNAGAYEYDTLNFTYESGWGTGTKYIFFQADGYNYVTESNESNNTAYRTINIAPPSITVTAPNGGNTLQMGQSYNITWNDNFSDDVRIWLYKGNEYLQTIVDFTESDGSYTWTLPTNLTPGNDYNLAVGIPGSTVTTYDFSDTDFSIIAPSQPDLVVQSQYAPNSATVSDIISLSTYTQNNGQASAGYSYTRYWLSDDATLNTSTDRYLGEDYVASLSAGSSEYDTFDFTYNSSWGTGTKYIFFQADGYSYVTEGNESNNTAYRTINIAPPSNVTVTSPNGGNTLQMGQSYNITWNDNFSDNVRIELYKGSSLVQTLSPSTASSGSFTWTPSTALAAGNDYRIKISNASNSNVLDYSDTYFTLAAPSQPDLVIQGQSAPSTVFVNDTVTISASVVNQGASSAGSSNIKYYLSNDTALDASDVYLGYDSISSLATNGSGSGSHSFTYNSTWGTGTKYILFQADADSAVTESNESNNVAYQSISVAVPTITVTSPNGSNTLQGGQGYYISWNDNLDENVRIDLYKGNSFVQNITTSTASDGEYYWVIPTSLSSGSDYRIQISGTTRSTIYDYSDSYFTVNQPSAIPNTYQPFNSNNVFSLNSNPGASHTIYLDFNSHTTTGTYWNTNYGLSSISTPSYDIDGNTSSFSAVELENIWRIWRRVSEDFIPFNVNVTTALPVTDDLVKSGVSDTRWGIRVVIGGDGSWYGGGGGVAQYDSFNSAQDTPAFVFSKNLANGDEKSVAEAISHEVGHSMNVRHDGTSSTGYYYGHGSGSTGWAPIMGVGYDQQLSQWSRGEYTDANNQEDDLSIITTTNGFSYRADDYGNQLNNAASLFFNGSTARTYGIIERNTDVDWFTFNSSTGNISLSVNPFEIGPNLDIMAKLYNSAGQLLQTFNPVEELFANITFSSNPGQYYLSIEGTGKSGLNGYSDYGSLGQYSITGTVS